MANNFVFTNVLGTFVFDSKFNLIERFKSEEDAKRKFPKAEEPKDFLPVLLYFKKPEFFDEFYKKNIDLTKKDIKSSVKKDWLIIQAINLIEDLERAINMLAGRLRDWYSLYNPEFAASIKDHEKFAELISTKTKDELLDEIGVKKSMGADFSKKDFSAVLSLAKEIKNMFALKRSQQDYLESLMKEACPNILAVAGALIGAKLVSMAGSLKNLAEMHASKIQLLGAEKALFRHMRTGAKCPRHGIIIQHPLIAAAKQSEHGKRARALADKLSIAAKVDYFKGEFIGDSLKRQLEKRFGRAG
ncbi:hypothetical protein D6745_03835 [Candidatus Woesearchaeota archaeon]|nr:MAG: hypothetical protein D6745_03835 [Candidatus Woesearchaeota archaeon]